MLHRDVTGLRYLPQDLYLIFTLFLHAYDAQTVVTSVSSLPQPGCSAQVTRNPVSSILESDTNLSVTYSYQQ